MAVTLLEAKVGMADKVDQAVVDEFRRSSLLLDALTFDDSVSPGTGGTTMTYGYTQLKRPSTANFRQINSEYADNTATREKRTADLKIFGGSSKVDRVIQNGSGVVNEIQFQLDQKIKGTTNLFHYTAINGDSVANGDEFDGLDTMLTGSSTEYNTTTPIALDNSTNLDANSSYFLDMLDEFLSGLDGTPTMLMGNNKLMSKIRSAARRTGYLTHAENAFGEKVTGYGGIPLVDLGYYWNGASTVPCVGVDGTAGTTDLYAATFGLDAFHGISMAGGSIVSTFLPDMSAPGAIKSVEVELVAGLVLKNSLKAGVFRNIKVQ